MANGRNKGDNALVVRTVAYPTSTVGAGPDDELSRPLPLARVEITGGPSYGSPPPAEVTDDAGEARFTDLAPGRYRITVTGPAGYAAPAAKDPVLIDGVRATVRTAAVTIRAGGDSLVVFGLAPQDGTVTGVVTGPATPEKIRVEARHNGDLVDRQETDASGRYTLTIDRPGLIEICAQATVPETPAPGVQTFVPEHGNGSQYRYVGPAETKTADIRYEATHAEIVVGALLLPNGKRGTQATPLDGVTFRLFKLGDTGPMAELTTQPHTTSVFRDLDSATYRIVAVPPAAAGARRVQIARPPGGELTLAVDPGQHLDLSEAFGFEPVRGSVLGSVVLAHDSRPVPGVAVVLSAQQQPAVVEEAVTDADGEFMVDGLPPGRYRITLRQSAVSAFGRRWEPEPAGTADGSRIVDVRARATTFVPEFRLTEELHLIEGRVLGPGDAGAPYVTVQIFDAADPSRDPIANVVTDETGAYTFRAESAGTYFVSVLEHNGFPQRRVPVTVNSAVVVPDLRVAPMFGSGNGGPPAGSGGGTPAPNPQPDNDFPFLTEEIDVGGRAGGARDTSSRGGDTGSTVQRELRTVLGVRPRASDPKGFLAALQQAFTVEEVAGHTRTTWNPRSYAAAIQADLGSITGAQASLHARAKGTLAQVEPLLDGLAPLRVDVDTENVEAIRAIVRSHLTELVHELGVEGGPRVQRVDQLLAFLLGGTPGDPVDEDARDPAQVGGALAVLRDRLGLDRFRINTVDEEQNFTNFLVVLDHVVGLAESWETQRAFFDRSNTDVEPFLGTQLVLLSRDLEVVAESVHEVEFAMNSVFLGPNERQTLQLTMPGGTAPMFLSELLDWVQRFATEEGRRLIDEGGRQGVVAFRPTIELLRDLVQAALVPPTGLQIDVPAAYRRQRVQRALSELADHLAAAAARVQQIGAPLEEPPLNRTTATLRSVTR